MDRCGNDSLSLTIYDEKIIIKRRTCQCCLSHLLRADRVRPCSQTCDLYPLSSRRHRPLPLRRRRRLHHPHPHSPETPAIPHPRRPTLATAPDSAILPRCASSRPAHPCRPCHPSPPPPQEQPQSRSSGTRVRHPSHLRQALGQRKSAERQAALGNSPCPAQGHSRTGVHPSG